MHYCKCMYMYHIDGLTQDCSNSIAKALELLQSCTKLSTCIDIFTNYLLSMNINCLTRMLLGLPFSNACYSYIKQLCIKVSELMALSTHRPSLIHWPLGKVTHCLLRMRIYQFGMQIFVKHVTKGLVDKLSLDEVMGWCQGIATLGTNDDWRSPVSVGITWPPISIHKSLYHHWFRHWFGSSSNVLKML